MFTGVSSIFNLFNPQESRRDIILLVQCISGSPIVRDYNTVNTVTKRLRALTRNPMNK